MGPRLICVRREEPNGDLSPCTRPPVGFGAVLSEMDRCPTCQLPLHRLPYEAGFWSIIDELVGPPPQHGNDVRAFTMAGIEWFFASHPHWRHPLTIAWLDILLDERGYPHDRAVGDMLLQNECPWYTAPLTRASSGA